MCRTILFVDDEAKVLNSLKRLFFDTDYNTFFAGSAQEGLKILTSEKIDMVITDMKMPEMNGYEFLKIVNEKYPSVIRIILSGYVDKEIMMKLVSSGLTKAYMSKPWNNEELKNSIAHIFERTSTTKQKSVMNIINKIDQLPVLPVIYQKILSLIQADKGISEISEYVEKEAGYASKILRIVNSAFYGVSTGSVKKAILYLGLNTVKDIVLSSETFKSFQNNTAMDEYIEQIWNHSSLSNKILHGLYIRIYSKKIPEEFAAAGLLHDVGNLILIRYFPDQFQEIFTQWKKEPHIPIIDIEKTVIGVEHTQLGAYLLDWWNLPSPLIDACLYHHGPFTKNVENWEIFGLMNIADAFSWKSAYGLRGIKVDRETYTLYRMSEKEINKEVEKILYESKLKSC